MDAPIRYEVRNHSLYVNGMKVPSDNDVPNWSRSIVQVGDKLLVCLDPSRRNGESLSEKEIDAGDWKRNAFAVNRYGKILWQIQAPDINVSYVGFNVREDGTVTAMTDYDRAYLLNLETGEIDLKNYIGR